MILGTWGAGWAGYQWGPWAGVLVGVVVRRARRPAARGRHGDLRRRPHRLRCRDQHPRPRRHPLPLGDRLRGRAGRRASPQSPPHRRHRARSSMPGPARPAARPCENNALVPGLRPRRHRCAACSPSVSLLTILAVAAASSRTYFVLWRTAFGLRLRSCGESPVRRRVARRQRLPEQVHRRRRLRRARRARRRVPRHRRRQHLPRGPDRRPRLHRPGRDDLRQLAARRPGRRRRAVRLHRRAAAAQRRRVGARAAAPARRSLLVGVAVWLAVRAARLAAGVSVVVVARRVAGLVPDHRRAARRASPR